MKHDYFPLRSDVFSLSYLLSSDKFLSYIVFSLFTLFLWKCVSVIAMQELCCTCYTQLSFQGHVWINMTNMYLILAHIGSFSFTKPERLSFVWWIVVLILSQLSQSRNMYWTNLWQWKLVYRTPGIKGTSVWMYIIIFMSWSLTILKAIGVLYDKQIL